MNLFLSNSLESLDTSTLKMNKPFLVKINEETRQVTYL